MPLYASTLVQHADRLQFENVAVKMHGLRPGTYRDLAAIDAIKYPYLERINEDQVIEACLTAANEGYDAVAVGCFFDPALQVLRSIVDIPVVSLAESCMTVATSVGRTFGLVTLCPDESGHLHSLARSYGFESRLAGIEGLTPGIDEFALEDTGGAAAREVVARFAQACRLLADQGAEVVIPGDGVLNEFLIRTGITQSAGLPVMDALGVLFHHAAMMVRLRRASGLETSRAHFYARPPQHMVDAARSFAGLKSVAEQDFSAPPMRVDDCRQ